MKNLNDSIKKYKSVLILESLLSRRLLSILRLASFTIFILFGSLTLLVNIFFDGLYQEPLFGITLIVAGIWIEQLLIYSYHNSYYFNGLNSIIDLDKVKTSDATYDVAKILFKNTSDATDSFCNSMFGNTILIRSGLHPQVIADFIQSPRMKIPVSNIPLPDKKIFSMIELGKYIMSHDLEFQKLLEHSGISDDTFIGALNWVVNTHHEEKRRLRWWGKDNLSRVQAVGRELAYGRAYILERFSKNISTGAVFSTLGADASFATELINKIESAMARTRDTNVLLIGEEGVGTVDLIMEVRNRIRYGKSLNAIANKQIVVLDIDRLFSSHQSKQSLELALTQLLIEATNAGNIIIVIENLSKLVREGEALGLFIPELIDPYLAHPDLQVIATDTPDNYHTYLERLGTFTRRFSEILVDVPDLSATIRVLQRTALQAEYRHHIIFTFNSLKAIASASDRYIVEGIMPDKAIELQNEVAVKASQTNSMLITEEFVYQYVGDKTGMPLGPVQDSERDLLLNLEDRLHKLVIGQNKAIDAVARTMRRARAGIQTADKPLGSFLFLGPTGVGKTETAKALATVFFNSEDRLQRIDMSEYSGPDGLSRLLGSEYTSGELSDLLREHPYCVLLLLDEFEKANQQIHDLFLQILDEGTFTDGRGVRVNARNSIIIATSNAGSTLIKKTVEQRERLDLLNQQIIDHIIKEDIYRPELINRFANVIIFEPLTIEEQTQVASLMLKDLYRRMKERGYVVQITKDLLELLVQKGYDPEFGARPMQRVLQDLIEEKIAQMIISGEVKKGDAINLSRADFNAEELNPSQPQ